VDNNVKTDKALAEYNQNNIFHKALARKNLAKANAKESYYYPLAEASGNSLECILKIKL